MTQKELLPLFSFACYLTSGILLVSPSDFGKLEGRLLTGNRLFILIGNGSLELDIQGRKCDIQAHAFLDVMETVTFRMDKFSSDLWAWGLFVTFEFASESLKSLRPGSQGYLLERLNIPVQKLSETECGILELQLTLLKNSLGNMKHYYRQEMAKLYFKSFSLELGNVMLEHSGNAEGFDPYIDKYDFIILNFLKLVSKHFLSEHSVDFYATSLCMSSKHLTRVVKEKIGKTPHEIICDEIMHRAMLMLEDGRIPVGQIAEELHFFDQASFSKFFKKQMKISPMVYRKKMTNGCLYGCSSDFSG